MDVVEKDGEEFLEVLIHGKNCPNWVEPTTIEEWKALDMVWEEEQVEGVENTWTFGRCPSCKAVIFQSWTGDVLEFGV